MDRFARVVLGYHGCLEPTASSLLSGTLSVDKWAPSENSWDWLGHGLYFWEHSPERALECARAKVMRASRRARKQSRPAVVGAVIQLGRCFDLMNVAHTSSLGETYAQVKATLEATGRTLPVNAGRDDDLLRRELDCLVVNWFVECSDVGVQTVRGAFSEGPPAYPGAKIMQRTHIQIAVRDKSCILGVFRPTL